MNAAAVRWRVAVAAGTLYHPTAARVYNVTLHGKRGLRVPVGRTTVRSVMCELEREGYYGSCLSTAERFYGAYPRFDRCGRPMRPHGNRALLRRPFRLWTDARLQRYLELAEACALACAELGPRPGYPHDYVESSERDWLRRVEFLRTEIARRLTTAR